MKYTTLILVAIVATTICGCTTTSSTLDSPELRRSYSASYADVFGEALAAVASLSWELTHSERESGVIQARTPKNLLTYGDKITIRVINEDGGSVRVDVTSGTDQAVDWGKNKQNIRKFYAALDRLVETRPRPTTSEG